MACTLPVTNPRGPPGIDGIDGKKGVDGADGRKGIDGIDGKKGIGGIDGKKGVDGVEGRKGVDGPDGLDGNNGPPGSTGIDGVKGGVGPTGQSLPGPQGADGIPGVKGKVGQEGIPGQDGAIGIDGIQGPDGIPLPGPRGIDGADGQALPGADGPDGIPGNKGADGLQGDDGPPGREAVSPAVRSILVYFNTGPTTNYLIPSVPFSLQGRYAGIAGYTPYMPFLNIGWYALDFDDNPMASPTPAIVPPYQTGDIFTAINLDATGIVVPFNGAIENFNITAYLNPLKFTVNFDPLRGEQVAHAIEMVLTRQFGPPTVSTQVINNSTEPYYAAVFPINGSYEQLARAVVLFRNDYTTRPEGDTNTWAVAANFGAGQIRVNAGDRLGITYRAIGQGDQAFMYQILNFTRYSSVAGSYRYFPDPV